MANHVTNRLTITGDSQSIAELFAGCFRKEKCEIPDFWRERASDSSIDSLERLNWAKRIAECEASEPYYVFDFNLIIPAPAFIFNGDELTVGSREEKTGRNWHKFNTARWGTNWNAYDMEIVERSDEKLVIKFDTAWSLPEPIINELVSWFPELKFFHEFYDEGGWFFGDRTYSSGLVIDNFISGEKRENHQEMENRLCKELKGYSLDDCDEED